MPEDATPFWRRVRPALIAVGVLAAVVAAAWVLQASITGGDAAPGGASAATAYSIDIQRDGKLLKRYDLRALHALPQSRVVIDHKAQTGPSLETLLSDAGAGRFSRLEARGAGLRDDGQVTLTAAQVAEHVQLDFSDRGTVKVCGPKLLRPDWVRDVLSIDVR
jgi:hypothetical protein